MYADIKLATYGGDIRDLFRGKSRFVRAPASTTHLALYECEMSENGQKVNLTASQSGMHPEIIFTAIGDDRAYVSREFQKLFRELDLQPRDVAEPRRGIILKVLYQES